MRSTKTINSKKNNYVVNFVRGLKKRIHIDDLLTKLKDPLLIDELNEIDETQALMVFEKSIKSQKVRIQKELLQLTKFKTILENALVKSADKLEFVRYAVSNGGYPSLAFLLSIQTIKNEIDMSPDTKNLIFKSSISPKKSDANKDLSKNKTVHSKASKISMQYIERYLKNDNETNKEEMLNKCIYTVINRNKNQTLKKRIKQTKEVKLVPDVPQIPTYPVPDDNLKHFHPDDIIISSKDSLYDFLKNTDGPHFKSIVEAKVLPHNTSSTTATLANFFVSEENERLRIKKARLEKKLLKDIKSKKMRTDKPTDILDRFMGLETSTLLRIPLAQTPIIQLAAATTFFPQVSSTQSAALRTSVPSIAPMQLSASTADILPIKLPLSNIASAKTNVSTGLKPTFPLIKARKTLSVKFFSIPTTSFDINKHNPQTNKQVGSLVEIEEPVITNTSKLHK